MTRLHLMTLTLLLMLADGVAATLVFLLVTILRFESDPTAVWSVGIDVGPAALLFAVLWVSLGWALGLYRLRLRWSLLAEAKDLLRASVITAATALSLLFILHQDNVSRVFLFLLFIAQFFSAFALRALLRWWFELLRHRGGNRTYMLIAGTSVQAQAFADRVESHRSLGIKVIGHVELPETREVYAVTRPTLGTINDLSAILEAQVIDEVALCLTAESTPYLEPLVAMAVEQGKTVRVPRAAEESILSGAVDEEFDGFFVRSIVHQGQREFERAVKRALDVVGAIVGIIVLSPLLLGAAAAIKLRDGSPVIFRQVRVGRHGRPFTIYKFRTMRIDAEDRYAEVAELSDTRGAAFKMKQDPRVTPLGATLRKWTLDELPQLFNVLKGDMSLVGPRPAPPREVDQYDIWHRRRLSVRPGMTGLWQVEARFDHHFDDRAQLDLRYIDQWSLWMDLQILAKTLPAVLSPPAR